MCGRYRVPADLKAVAPYLKVIEEIAPLVDEVRPTDRAPVVRRHRGTGARKLDLLRWGLVPSWSDGPSGTPLFNARAETVAAKPSFRDAFERRRCLVPAELFIEWHEKRPHEIRRADGAPLVLGGLWERWRQPDGTALDSYTIVTVAASSAMAGLHDRMPLILEEGQQEQWLAGSAADASRMLMPWEGRLGISRSGPDAPSDRGDLL